MCLFQCCQLKILIPSHLIPLSYLSSIGIYKCPHRSILSYPIQSNPILSNRIITYRIVSYGMVWYGIVSYGMVWHGVVSYRIVSYPILCNLMLSPSVESSDWFYLLQFIILQPSHHFYWSLPLHSRQYRTSRRTLPSHRPSDPFCFIVTQNHSPKKPPSTLPRLYYTV